MRGCVKRNDVDAWKRKKQAAFLYPHLHFLGFLSVPMTAIAIFDFVDIMKKRFSYCLGLCNGDCKGVITARVAEPVKEKISII